MCVGGGGGGKGGAVGGGEQLFSLIWAKHVADGLIELHTHADQGLHCLHKS